MVTSKREWDEELPLSTAMTRGAKEIRRNQNAKSNYKKMDCVYENKLATQTEGQTDTTTTVQMDHLLPPGHGPG